MDNKCNSCHVVVLANTVIKWLIGITFMIFAGMAVYAGVKMVISGGNSHAKQDAKEMFTNAFIGLLIILGAWLMIDTLLRYVLKNGETGNIEGYGPWSQVKCVSETLPGITELVIQEEEFSSYYADDSAIPISGNVPSGSIQQKILSATLAYRGSSTAAGPGGGNLACAWAINNILRNADGDSVKEMERVLVSGRGARINQSDAVGGDLVLLIGAKTSSGKTGNHVGVCLNSGCTSVLSNSSSKATFSWPSGPTFSPSYSGGTPRFFRIKS
jgi:hypothetical protein